MLRPADPNEARQAIPPDFYALLDRNKDAFATATSREDEDATTPHKGGANDAYILKRLKAKQIRRYHGCTDEDEEYIRNVIPLLMDGSLPKPTTKKVAEALKREIEPLKVLGILRRDISPLFFQSTRAQLTHHSLSPREVILSSWLISGNGRHGDDEAKDWSHFSLHAAFRGMEDEDFSAYDKIPVKERY